MRGGELVFGYGSLVSIGVGRRAVLRGHRRVWGVAMDNRRDLEGYKSYRLRTDGSRPAVFVAFLDIVQDPGTDTEGVLVAVDEMALAELDARERNYERIDVSAAFDDAPGRIWTYRGSPAGRARLKRGDLERCVVVDRTYLAAVRAGFAAHGIDVDIDPAPLPVLDLERRELPAAPGGATGR
jgi:hypothetical protein